MDIQTNWLEIKTLFKCSFKSSFHYAIASVSEDGNPHITPIGSLILTEPGKGYYFEKFTTNLPKSAKDQGRVCILAVNGSIWYWLRSLLKGEFVSRPAVRLYGTLGVLREASESEKAKFQKRVGKTRFTRGYKLLWKNMSKVREIEFDKVEQVKIGSMTKRFV
ncbi:pyridoxamine 5'-phosphate oxidase family protein [Pseudoalteromonas luteoviolacea]|uniref:Pyridoxamine 5'-phosphate oxidase putative domain-containing protein n=1 Tax=Pseudoalteromonas luteoviolacea S4054 TaxID=1129367 RepID=A0A0F6AAN9_9GAMM|nr:pyridoxamine 5'-phosphate oxidase family protein [Pseudoalteromonas luteoviolacea]AOT10841.1 hypothetical protein S4054249_23635 [Pseudoalteromonas luteoviolacea]AOT15997.1 hypothetical protein S40542_24875 [Pseudoalteromonas luteoviolacea]AOT20662.1 hypothetical protein S4054_23555 [Pseudoalteromonas luteoviolacea]KKE82891.1 hypothetical protein N479_16595 [Pseudoalteromonas luteoviolacea S4054]KZN75228.1 hypothetical protein N481_07890 [Pseudoalteromonas luteoviolacea S4047-1]